MDRRKLFVTLLAEKKEPFPLNLFRQYTPVSIERDQFGAYRLIQPIGSDLYSNVVFTATYSVGGAWMRIQSKSVARLMAGRAIDHASVAKSGTWSTSDNQNYFTARFSSSNTSGAYVQITTDPGVTAVGMFNLGVGNNSGGFYKVTIDGDATLADLLRTAQQYVDDGILPNTVLVANGGTLNPTDRICDYDSTGATIPQMFTRSLSAGSHVVRVTRTGYKITASANAALLFCGFVVYGTGLYGPSETYRYMDIVQQTQANAADEISWFFKPNGTSNGAWLGHTGMAVIKELPVITVDGVDKSADLLNRNTIISGNEIVITTKNDVRHPETGTTSQGIFDMVFTLNKNGLDIYHKTSWSVSGTVYGFPCMLTANNTTFDRCANSAGTHALVKDNNNHINADTNKIWFFDSDGNQATIMTIYDLALTVDNWATAGTMKLFCWDANQIFAKGYANRFDIPNTLSFTNTTVLESKANYRIAWLADGTAKLAV